STMEKTEKTEPETFVSSEKDPRPMEDGLVPLDQVPKGRWERSWPTIACGAGLFSDGYLNGVIGQVNTMLGKIYGDAYSDSTASQNVSAIAFAGTVVGMLGGMLAALTAYRFFIGIGIGGEYPAGSVSCAENTGELKEGHRNRWFIMFTNFQIDFAFVISAFVPMILCLIFTEDHLRAAWRMALGLGVIPPLSLLYLRLKLDEPEEFKREKMAKFPIWLIIKFYWWRLSVVSLIWFVYDFSSYSFGLYSSQFLTLILGDSPPLWKTFGWTTLIYLFYIPGSALEHLQGIVGFIMSGCYEWLATEKYMGAFIVVYGVFLALGEFGPGDNIGLCAAKTCATAIRGQYYSYAAALGKIGAFVGTYVLPIAVKNAHTPVEKGQHPFFISSALCIFSAVVAFFLLPTINQDTITHEDERFRAYLEEHGYDTTSMGVSAN
ncbi:Glycerophosphodiester transporter GIT2, partial [Penicillium chermesinum]